LECRSRHPSSGVKAAVGENENKFKQQKYNTTRTTAQYHTGQLQQVETITEINKDSIFTDIYSALCGRFLQYGH